MKLAIASAAIGFLATAVAPVFATSSATHNRVATPGTACTTISGTASYLAGGVMNGSSTTPLVVDCPLGYSVAPTSSLLQIHGAYNANGSTITCAVYQENLVTGGWRSVSLSTAGPLTGRLVVSSVLSSYAIDTLASLHAYCTLSPRTGPSLTGATISGFEVQGL